jgi:hypothetical protein
VRDDETWELYTGADLAKEQNSVADKQAAQVKKLRALLFPPKGEPAAPGLAPAPAAPAAAPAASAATPAAPAEKAATKPAATKPADKAAATKPTP